MSTVDELLDRFFACVEAGDVDALAELYADDAEVWLNVTGRTSDRAENLRTLAGVHRVLAGMRYELLERRTWEDGAVQRHVLHGSVDGEPVALAACIVFHVEAGRVRRVFEYLDGAAARPVTRRLRR